MTSHKMLHTDIVTTEPCLIDAKRLVQMLQRSLLRKRNRRLQSAFTALAGGDSAVGLMAYYLWRRRIRRRM
jgi:hypothetical protein